MADTAEVEERRHLLAKNIRILMGQQDVTNVHLAHLLGASKDHLAAKINGKIAFSAKEVKDIAKGNYIFIQP